jgi:hypothetical protein
MRHILLWPLQISVSFSGANRQVIRDALSGTAGNFVGAGPWSPLADEFTADASEFKERHYKEFVTFLPYVQRFLYGESRSRRRPADDPPAEAAVEVFRRRDVARLRIRLRPDTEPLLLDIAHCDLYLFADLDVMMLNVELRGAHLSLSDALDQLHRFGRAYPAGWNVDGSGMHHAASAEWLDHNGAIIAASDTAAREKYLRFVCEHRAPAVAAHWDQLLRPFVLDHSNEQGTLRYRVIEYYRMPFMAFLAVDDPKALTREDYMHIGLVSQVRHDDVLPREASFNFERNHCEDRYWSDRDDGPHTRFLMDGQSLIVAGDAHSTFFVDPEHGQLAQFRHQICLLFMIAHQHRAALLSFSDHLSDATNDLNVHSTSSVRRFKRRIRSANENFLRFTHRYWFHQLSQHALVQSLFARSSQHLGNDELYRDVREELRDMVDYLDSDAQRRQSGTMMRLTVVTTFGLIGTVATGFLGMNLISEADATIPTRVGYFAIVLAGAAALTLFAVARSARLADLLETIASERIGLRAKLAACANVFSRK